MLWPQQDHPTGNPRSTATAQDRKDNSFLGPMVIAACEQHLPESQRVLSDELAVQFLPPGLRLVTGACRWRAVHDLLAGATDKKALGLWAST